jgi:hypothetical protein
MVAKVKQSPEKFAEHYVNDPATGRNYFVDGEGRLLVEYPDVKGSEVIGFGDIKEKGITSNFIYKDSISHPDPEAEILLAGSHLRMDPSRKGSSFSSGYQDKIEVKTANKPTAYETVTAEWGRLMEGRSDLKTTDPQFWEKMKSLQVAGAELSERVKTINTDRKRLQDAFNVSFLAHEGTHKAQKESTLPRGGSPSNEAHKIFEETIGRDPEKLAAYNESYNLVRDWVAKDPISLMVAITQLKPKGTTYSKYADLVEAGEDGLAHNKFFKKVRTVDDRGIATESTKPNEALIISTLLKDIYIGNLDVQGTKLEPFVKLNVDAFKAYKNISGEVYARVAQKRAFDALSGKDPDVYKKNPQSYIDVDLKDIDYSGSTGNLSQMESFHGSKGGWSVPKLAEIKKYKGKSEQGFGFYTTESPISASGHGAGNVKQFDIPDELLPDLLNRTKPMIEQSDHVYNAIVNGARASVDGRISEFDPFFKAAERMSIKGAAKTTGSQFYNMLVEEYTKHLPGKDSGEKLFRAKVAASEKLDELGIKGAMYLSPKGARNTVLWNQEVLDKMDYKNFTPDLSGGYISDRGLLTPPKNN